MIIKYQSSQNQKFSMLFLLCSFLLVACATSVKQMPVVPVKQSIDLADRSLVITHLKQQLSAWQGVKYKLGGLSKSGIDCSGFVYLTYLSRFGIELPRSTETQAEQGVNITRSKLRPGDLVFFKTGIFQKHVGIYLGSDEFIHASTSIGVTKSRLDNTYWADRFWLARRMSI